MTSTDTGGIAELEAQGVESGQTRSSTSQELLCALSLPAIGRGSLESRGYSPGEHPLTSLGLAPLRALCVFTCLYDAGNWSPESIAQWTSAEH